MEYKLLPYGMTDFKEVILNNYYFVDKTRYIKSISQSGRFLFFLRPRRFGKSLFLSMLQTYYDIKERENFDKYFAGTWIADNPTADRGTYQVLKFDFSKIGDSADNILEKFNIYACSVINEFLDKYKEYYPEKKYEEIYNCQAADEKLNMVVLCSNRLENPLYLIVDEYDNFTNTILTKQGHEMYHAITHASGFYRDFFKIFKGSFSRIIMTGVSPVTLDDLTSGYNIANNLTLNALYNGMMGFNTEEIRDMIHYYQDAGVLRSEDEEKMITEMAAWYDGYCFSKRAVEKGTEIFNSSMVIRYIQNYIDEGNAPENLLDPNTKTDYDKLKQLLKLDQQIDYRRSTLLKIAQEGYTSDTVEGSFPAERLFDAKNFVSLLYYYGMLTYTTINNDIVLGIPNNNVRKQYYDFLREEYNNIRFTDTSGMDNSYKKAARDGDWRSLIEYVCRCYHENASVRCLIEGEANVRGYMMAFLRFNNYYQAVPEVELNYGYSDLILLPKMDAKNVNHSYIIELKYLPLTATPAAADKQWKEAVDQVHSYAQGHAVQRLAAGTQLHTLVVQIKGTELLQAEEV